MRREDELSAAAIDQRWPHQVALPAQMCERDGYNEIHEFSRLDALLAEPCAVSRWSMVSRLLLQKASGRAKVHGEIRRREIQPHRARPWRRLGEMEKRLAPAAAACGRKGATIRHPGWGGEHAGYMAFPTPLGARSDSGGFSAYDLVAGANAFRWSNWWPVLLQVSFGSSLRPPRPERGASRGVQFSSCRSGNYNVISIIYVFAVLF